jgi:hypothetical protein
MYAQERRKVGARPEKLDPTHLTLDSSQTTPAPRAAEQLAISPHSEYTTFVVRWSSSPSRSPGTDGLEVHRTKCIRCPYTPSSVASARTNGSTSVTIPTVW